MDAPGKCAHVFIFYKAFMGSVKVVEPQKLSLITQ